MTKFHVAEFQKSDPIINSKQTVTSISQNLAFPIPPPMGSFAKHAIFTHASLISEVRHLPATTTPPASTRTSRFPVVVSTPSFLVSAMHEIRHPQQPAEAEIWGTRSFVWEKYFLPGLSPEAAVARVHQTTEGMHDMHHSDLKNAMTTLPENLRRAYVKVAEEVVDNMSEHVPIGVGIEPSMHLACLGKDCRSMMFPHKPSHVCTILPRFRAGFQHTTAVQAVMSFSTRRTHLHKINHNSFGRSTMQFHETRRNASWSLSRGGKRNRRANTWKVNALPDWPLMAVMVEHVAGSRDWVVTKSVWHLNDEEIKNVYTMYIMFTCWGCCFFASMKDPFYDGESYRKDGGDGSAYWLYEKQEDIEEQARAELWREELIEEIEKKVGGLRELEEAKEEELVK